MTDIIKIEDHKPLEETAKASRLIVFAKNPQEMSAAQDKLITWAKAKVREKQAEQSELQQNYEIAKKNKWRSEVLKRHADGAQKKVEFYEKTVAALEAGYSIVPNMDIDIFAIRTSRQNPKDNMVSGNWERPRAQQSNRPPVGEGRYQDPIAKVAEKREQVTNREGKPETHITRWADEFDDVDFPFKFAKPEILEATAAALKDLIFDEVGILPRRRVAGDPMIIGRIRYKDGNAEKAMSFCIAWFVDTDDL